MTMRNPGLPDKRCSIFNRSHSPHAMDLSATACTQGVNSDIVFLNFDEFAYLGNNKGKLLRWEFYFKHGILNAQTHTL